MSSPSKAKAIIGGILKRFLHAADPDQVGHVLAGGTIKVSDGWITIKSKGEEGEEGGEGKGYRRILLGQGGKILGGDLPRKEQGKELGKAMVELKKEGGGTEPEPEKRKEEELASKSLTRETAFKAWRDAYEEEQEVRGQHGFWSKETRDAEKATQRAKYRCVPFMDDKEYGEERQNTISSMLVGSPGTAKDRDKYVKLIVEGSSTYPYDVLDKLREKGLQVEVMPGKGRCQYSPSERRITLYQGTKDTVVAHEMAHAVDHLFANAAYTSQGLSWGTSLYVGESENDVFPSFWSGLKEKAQGLKAEFNSLKTVRGTYKNGDGDYWKDNWVNDYEGRIYNRHGPGVEWWAMVNQYYHTYQSKHKGYQERLAYLKKESEFKGGQTPYSERMKAEHKKLSQQTPAEYAARNSAEWAKAKKRYPKLTAFIEENFGADKRMLGKW